MKTWLVDVRVTYKVKDGSLRKCMRGFAVNGKDSIAMQKKVKYAVRQDESLEVTTYKIMGFRVFDSRDPSLLTFKKGTFKEFLIRFLRWLKII